MPKLGYKQTEEHKINTGNALKGKKKPLGFGKGRVFSEEAKKKMSATAKGRIFTDEHKRKLGLAHKGLKRSDEVKRKMSLSKMGHFVSEEQKEKMRINTLGRRKEILLSLQKQFKDKRPTSIEQAVYDYLLLKGILFERQYLVNGRFLVDVYIPSLNIIIEADGKYWHDMDRVRNKDRAENAYLKKCGFNLIRLTEKEILSGNFKERLVL